MKKSRLVIGIIAAVILFLLIFGNPFSSPTIAEFKRDYIQRVDKELRKPNNKFRESIESAHKTVTVKDAYISSCTVTTRDGSNNAGRKGSNISTIDLKIHSVWDGKFHKNGYTDLRVILDFHEGKGTVRNAEIVATNALINTKSPYFWSRVGVIKALLIL